MDRPLTNQEYWFLLNYMHYNSPSFSNQLVRSQTEFACWEGDQFEILPQADTHLMGMMIKKLKQEPENETDPPALLIPIYNLQCPVGSALMATIL